MSEEEENIKKLQASLSKMSAVQANKTGQVKARKPSKKLNEREKEFIRNYIRGMTIRAAAIKAGIPEATADTKAHRWLCDERADSTRPDMWDYWKQQQNVYLRRWEVNADNIIANIQMIAASDISHFVELHSNDEIEDPNQTDPEKIFMRLSGRTLRTKSFAEIPKELLPCIKSISEDKHGIKIALWDKMQALDMLARIKGMYISKNGEDPGAGYEASGLRELNLVIDGTKSPLMQKQAKQDSAGVTDAEIVPEK